jgi:hypothetical protein
MRDRHEAPPDPSDLSPGFHRGDHFGIRRPKIPQTEQCRSGPVRDNGAVATSQNCRNQPMVAISTRMTNRKGRSEQRVEASGC